MREQQRCVRWCTTVVSSRRSVHVRSHVAGTKLLRGEMASSTGGTRYAVAARPDRESHITQLTNALQVVRPLVSGRGNVKHARRTTESAGKRKGANQQRAPKCRCGGKHASRSLNDGTEERRGMSPGQTKWLYGYLCHNSKREMIRRYVPFQDSYSRKSAWEAFAHNRECC